MDKVNMPMFKRYFLVQNERNKIILCLLGKERFIAVLFLYMFGHSL